VTVSGCEQSANRSQDGFALVLALVVLLVLSLGAALGAEQVQATLTRLTELERVSDFRMRSLTGRSDVIFALLKHDAEQAARVQAENDDLQMYENPSGDEKNETESALTLEDMLTKPASFTNKALDLAGLPSQVLVRDGLIDLNNSNTAYIAFVANLMGVQQPEKAAAILGDFIDSDSFTRPDGFERAGYGDDADIVPNRPLTSTEEACGVRGWERALFCTDPVIAARMFAIGPGQDLRFGSSPNDLKRLILGDAPVRADMEQVAWTILARSGGFFDMNQLGGSDWGGAFVILLGPDPQTGLFERVEVKLMDNRSGRPWTVTRSYQAGTGNAGGVAR
jgi:hypothetical protein